MYLDDLNAKPCRPLWRRAHARPGPTDQCLGRLVAPAGVAIAARPPHAAADVAVGRAPYPSSVPYTPLSGSLDRLPVLTAFSVQGVIRAPL